MTANRSVNAGRLRLVHSRHPILKAVHLAQFETPKTWAEILQLEPRMSKARWRKAIMDADHFGFGHLTFVPAAHVERSRRGTWVLTDKGREYVSRARATP